MQKTCGHGEDDRASNRIVDMTERDRLARDITIRYLVSRNMAVSDELNRWGHIVHCVVARGLNRHASFALDEVMLNIMIKFWQTLDPARAQGEYGGLGFLKIITQSALGDYWRGVQAQRKAPIVFSLERRLDIFDDTARTLGETIADPRSHFAVDSQLFDQPGSYDLIATSDKAFDKIWQDELTSDERLCLGMSRAEGCTAREISEQTGMPENTLYSHVKRAIKKFSSG